jgi:hypothetical protein
MPDAAAWRSHIACAAWDEMYVAVKNGLPGIGATIHTDIKARD